MKNITINIDGMTCNGCVNAVSNALNAITGIGEITVSLADSNAVIEYDENHTNSEALIQAIEDAGFDAHLG